MNSNYKSSKVDWNNSNKIEMRKNINKYDKENIVSP